MVKFVRIDPSKFNTKPLTNPFKDRLLAVVNRTIDEAFRERITIKTEVLIKQIIANLTPKDRQILEVFASILSTTSSVIIGTILLNKRNDLKNHIPHIEFTYDDYRNAPPMYALLCQDVRWNYLWQMGNQRKE